MIDKEKRIKSSLYVTFYQSFGVLGLEMFFIKMIRGSVILRYEYVLFINMDFFLDRYFRKSVFNTGNTVIVLLNRFMLTYELWWQNMIHHFELKLHVDILYFQWIRKKMTKKNQNVWNHFPNLWKNRWGIFQKCFFSLLYQSH